MTIRNYRCFNSRTPRGVRHRLSARRTLPKRFNSRTPRGVRHRQQKTPGKRLGVSIHAPRVGCDKRNGVVTLDKDLFQFTHPAWGATFVGYSRLDKIEPFQFTHPAWGATVGGFLQAEYLAVSIHAPRVGCDTAKEETEDTETMFQFTHPAWGATITTTVRGDTVYVSIHAPRVGCDEHLRAPPQHPERFNSRTPRGVRRHDATGFTAWVAQFQFTHPAWGATPPTDRTRRARKVSIHAPRVGCDC